MLAKSGVGRFVLIDNDILNWGNVARHALGGGYVGQAKATALANYLEKQMPYQDDSMTIKLGPPTDALSKFQNVDALEKQLERDGNEVKRLTIKVLFNLLVLKSLLHKDDVTIPFFLDEIGALDPANQRAIIQTAKKLGFIAITAAPIAVGEVDICYFLEPNKRGRVLLTDDQCLILRPKTDPPPAK